MEPPTSPSPRAFDRPDGTVDWDARYRASEAPVFGDLPNVFLTQAVGVLEPGSRVLCVADGDGRNGVWLAQQGFRVTSFDLSPAAVEMARARAAGQGVVIDAHVADADGFAWPTGAFDAVVAIFVQFGGPDERRSLFARIHAALAPGGHLILVGYGLAQLGRGTGGPRTAEALYSPAALRDELGAFQIDQMDERERVMDEGAAHHGPSAVIEVVARA